MDRNQNSRKSKGGGVCVYINNKYCYPAHITVKHRVCTKDIELLALSLRPYHLPREIHQIRLFVVYIAPSADTQAAASMIHELVAQVEAEAPDAPTFVMGDFNLCSLKEHLPTYQQYFTCPTRNTACLGQCYGNIQDAFYPKVLPGLGNSDPNMIKLMPAYVSRLRREKARKVEVKSWTVDATEALRDCLERTDWNVVTDGTENANDVALAISGYITFCEDTIIPKKTVKMFSNNKPWVTPELKQLLNQKKRLFKSGGNREEKRTVPKNIKSMIRECKAAYKRKLESFFRYDARRAWQGVQAITGYKPKKYLMAVDNELDMANDLNDFYCRFDIHDFRVEQDLVHREISGMKCVDIDISIDDVKSYFRHVNPRKASGPDGICNRTLKMCADQLAQPFQRLFQLSIDTGVVPCLWKKSLIVPVPKNNKPRELNDLRPVALTSTVMKCFEKIFLKQLLCEVSPLLDPNQFAYRAERGVEDALLTLTNNIYEHLEQAKSLVKIVFIGFSSAFNTIQLHLMVKKLVHLGVNPKIVLWMYDFLTNRCQQVKFNSCVSSLKAINTGAPQGCVLSPILYTLYTNNCQAASSDHTYFKYADDTALVGFLKSNTTSLEGFEREMQGFMKWCTDNFLVVNAKKTKEMVLDFNKKEIIVPPSNISGEVVERVSRYTYLGVEIDNKLTFKECAQNKTKKLQKRMFFLRKLKHFQIDSCFLQMFYKSLLQSVLSFGIICAFGNMYIQDQKKLQRVVKIASRIIGVDQVSVAQLHNDLSLNKIDQILNDSTHPLHLSFLRSSRSSGRILQRKIRTTSYNKSFVPTAIRLYNIRQNNS
uniref:Reverse transcriptase domain-containing protein n=1 Tax=Sparus aurata TaxID=8175 RepID=A0A671TU97_SPAAU